MRQVSEAEMVERIIRWNLEKSYADALTALYRLMWRIEPEPPKEIRIDPNKNFGGLIRNPPA
jgi:hypothetical protein